MADIVRRIPIERLGALPPEAFLEREWLITNGLGGYSSGTVAGPSTRRYHGLLIAALPAPAGRRMMLNHLMEELRFPDGSVVHLGGEEKVGAPRQFHGTEHLAEFRLEAGLPVWVYEVRGTVFERRVHMAHMQNTVYVHHRLLRGGPVRLRLRPAIHFRSHDAPVSDLHDEPYRFSAVGDRYEIAAARSGPPLRLYLRATRATFTIDGRLSPEVLYRVEESRGYESRGDLWSPGFFRADLTAGSGATLVASAEEWEVVFALDVGRALEAEQERRRRLLGTADPRARSGMAAELVLAADQFVITPAGRIDDAALVRATGDELRSVIAGYHWFTDWGRDTMISLEGLTLATGRHVEAGYILRTFAHYIRDGLIPNLFPEGKRQGLYHTADATLWYFHAIARYVEITRDLETLAVLLPRLESIIRKQTEGTRFGIRVDPADGLLRQGEEGYQLTWMDAKVGDWVVTPRRGKAVEINALWYNALRLMADWVRGIRGEAAARPYAEAAERARHSFNRRFWYATGGYLYDVVDGDVGDDPSCRPNQVFAISLPHPVLDPAHWQPVVDVIRERLLTPFGLRTLAPGSPDYKSKYYGDLRARDAAYHQGTVWPWLIGAFVDAWLRVHPGDRATAQGFLGGIADALGDACVGTISEIFDAEPPFQPRGCVAQAWSVAEVLRAWLVTAERDESGVSGAS